MRTWFYASRWTARWSALCAICGEMRTRLGWISFLASVCVLASCCINSQRIVVSVILFLSARKVVPMMDERNERRVKRSVLLGFNTLSKKRAKNYITKAVKKRLSRRCCCCCSRRTEEKRRKERESTFGVNMVRRTPPFCCFFAQYSVLFLQTTLY